MKLRLPQLFPLAIVMLLAAGTLWLQRLTQGEPERGPDRTRHDPDYYAENFSIKRFDDKGALQYAIDADRMVHYPDDDSTEVFVPRVLYLGKGAPTRLKARRGVISRDGEVIDLHEDVFVRREPAPGQPELTLATTALTVLPEDEIARTRERVRLTQGKSVLFGTGMELNNVTAVAVLYSKVSGTLYPARKK